MNLVKFTFRYSLMILFMFPVAILSYYSISFLKNINTNIQSDFKMFFIIFCHTEIIISCIIIFSYFLIKGKK